MFVSAATNLYGDAIGKCDPKSLPDRSGKVDQSIDSRWKQYPRRTLGNALLLDRPGCNSDDENPC
jgi:hypothetical protein